MHTFSLGFLNEKNRFSNAEESEEHQGRCKSPFHSAYNGIFGKAKTIRLKANTN